MSLEHPRNLYEMWARDPAGGRVSGPALEHVTANTGHVRVCPRSEVAGDVLANCEWLEGVLASLQPLLATVWLSGACIGVRHRGDPWTWTATEAPGALTVEVHAPDGRPVARFAVGTYGRGHARAAWDAIAAEGTPDPGGLTRPWPPWLIVAWLPALTDHPPDGWAWLEDFERRMAWAWLDLQGAAAKRAERVRDGAMRIRIFHMFAVQGEVAIFEDMKMKFTPPKLERRLRSIARSRKKKFDTDFVIGLVHSLYGSNWAEIVPYGQPPLDPRWPFYGEP